MPCTQLFICAAFLGAPVSAIAQGTNPALEAVQAREADSVRKAREPLCGDSIVKRCRRMMLNAALES